MQYLRVTGFRTSSRDGRLEFSLQDELGRWGQPQQVEPQIGIDVPVEMNDKPALRFSLASISSAKPGCASASGNARSGNGALVAQR